VKAENSITSIAPTLTEEANGLKYKRQLFSRYSQPMSVFPPLNRLIKTFFKKFIGNFRNKAGENNFVYNYCISYFQ
jgi:hypothetical protein